MKKREPCNRNTSRHEYKMVISEIGDQTFCLERRELKGKINDAV